MNRLRARLLAVVVACCTAAVLAAPAQAAENTGWSTLNRITTNAQWDAGYPHGVKWSRGTLSIDRPVSRTTFQGVTYSYAFWTSPWVSPGRRFTQLIPSWTAKTPPGTWLHVLVRVRTADGRSSRFKDLGRWSTSDQAFHRGSAGGQSDSIARVATDTLVSTGPVFTRYQFRLKLLRRNGLDGRRAVTWSPTVRSLQAVVSRLPASFPATSRPLSTSPVLLRVPRYSQMIHEGQNPQYGGGGEAWCSPTSLAMVLSWFGKRPPSTSYSWVPSTWQDRFVNHVARLTYDYRYEGTGNWPFNTGLASSWIGDSFVTRLPDLRTAERFVRAGIPVIASVAFGRGELTGAPISATNGHLLVIVGFTARGNVIVNDPAAPTNAGVRRTYDRAQFERAWLDGSGGLSYVLHDREHPLPKRPAGVRAW
ncbi:MAG TPA: peptidase C39 family protein [Marmoricola sp.]|nr:peptidase C39 family protein [Marmoricola sp.]